MPEIVNLGPPPAACIICFILFGSVLLLWLCIRLFIRAIYSPPPVYQHWIFTRDVHDTYIKGVWGYLLPMVAVLLTASRFHPFRQFCTTSRLPPNFRCAVSIVCHLTIFACFITWFYLIQLLMFFWFVLYTNTNVADDSTFRHHRLQSTLTPSSSYYLNVLHILSVRSCDVPPFFLTLRLCLTCLFGTYIISHPHPWRAELQQNREQRLL